MTDGDDFKSEMLLNLMEVTTMFGRKRKLTLLAMLCALLVVGFATVLGGKLKSNADAGSARDAERIGSLLSYMAAVDVDSLEPIKVEPFVLPNASVDVMRVRMEETYDIDGIGRDTVQLKGWIAVKHSSPRPAAGETEVRWGTAVSDTEFVGMDLRGESSKFGPLIITLNPDLPSKGQVGKLSLSEEEQMALHNAYVAASGGQEKYDDVPRIRQKGYEGIANSLRGIANAIERQDAKALLEQYDQSPDNTYFNAGAARSFRGAKAYVDYLSQIFTRQKLDIRFGEVRVIQGAPNQWALVEVSGVNSVVKDAEGRSGGEAGFHMTQLYVKRGRNWVSKYDSFSFKEEFTTLRAAPASAAKCVAAASVSIYMPKLDLRMHTKTPVIWYSEVETIPPVGFTASISHIPTPLISNNRTVGTLTSGLVRFREVVKKVDLEAGR